MFCNLDVCFKSWCGEFSMTLANGHSDFSMLSSAIITRSLTFIFHKYDVNFCLLVKFGTYSLIHFFQNTSMIAFIAFYFAHRFVTFSVIAVNLWFGDAQLMKKWFSVKDSMFLESLVTRVSGWFLFPLSRCEMSLLLYCDLLKMPWGIFLVAFTRYP